MNPYFDKVTDTDLHERRYGYWIQSRPQRLFFRTPSEMEMLIGDYPQKYRHVFPERWLSDNQILHAIGSCQFYLGFGRTEFRVGGLSLEECPPLDVTVVWAYQMDNEEGDLTWGYSETRDKTNQQFDAMMRDLAEGGIVPCLERLIQEAKYRGLAIPTKIQPLTSIRKENESALS